MLMGITYFLCHKISFDYFLSRDCLIGLLEMWGQLLVHFEIISASVKNGDDNIMVLGLI